MYVAWIAAKDSGEDMIKFVKSGQVVPAFLWDIAQPDHPKGDCVILNMFTNNLFTADCNNEEHNFVCEVFPQD